MATNETSKTILIVNAETGESLIRELTDEEMARHKSDIAERKKIEKEELANSTQSGPTE